MIHLVQRNGSIKWTLVDDWAGGGRHIAVDRAHVRWLVTGLVLGRGIARFL